MTRLLTVLVFASALLVSAERAIAEGKRVALVVGVSAYQNVPRLPNAAGDATAMAELFKKAGFNVVSARSDVSNLEFKRAIREFEDSVNDADIAVVFYAGHGIEIRETNYLIPTDAKLLNERDAEDEAITLDRLISALEPAKRLRLIILDACRDNPFASKMKRRVATRQVGVGLGKVEPAMKDTLIAYAAKDKSVAADGDGEHSPFTTALLRHLTEPGRDVRIAFGHVRDEVLRATGQKQEPYVYGSVGGGTVALVPAPVQVAALATPRADLAAKSDYELVERLGKREAWELFLNTHKTGLYAELARVQLAKLAEPDSQARTTSPGGVSGGQAKVSPSAPALPSTPKPSPEEQRAWDRLRTSSDRAGLRRFLDLYPTSPLAGPAQDRLEALETQAREREEAVRAQREADLQREEEGRRAKAAEAERKQLEREAARQREAEERARVAEAARQKAEALAAAKQRDAEERARVAEALARQREEERARAEKALAERREAEQRIKAAEAERQRLAREAAARAAAEDALRQQALAQDEEATRKAAAARREAEELARVAEAERQKAERDALAARESQDVTRAAEAARNADREKAVAEAAELERRKAAEAAKVAAKIRAEREAAAERREAAAEARRAAENAAAASRRKAAEIARRAAEKQAERQEAAAERRRREARAAKEVVQTRAARARPAPQQPRPQVAAAPRPAAPQRSSGAASMVGIGF